MVSFSKVCRCLSDAVSLSEIPKYRIKPEAGFKDVFDMERKVKYKYEKWLSYKPQNSPPPLQCLGCCEVDEFNGNELLRILHHLISRDDICRPGKFLYFSKKQSFTAALFFKSFLPMGITPFFEDDKNLEYRFLFEKLFDDAQVKIKKETPNDEREYYSADVVERLRREALELFPIFLKTKVEEFPLFPFGNSFFGLLISIAFQICRRRIQPNLTSNFAVDIPFMAGVYFAFNHNLIGKLTKLCGERNSRASFGENDIIEVVREIIKK